MRKRSVHLNYTLICGLSLLLILVHRAVAQSPPVDLTELSLEELLGVRLINVPADDAGTLQHGASNTRIGYRYIRLRFEDYIDGTQNRSAEEVLSDFPVAPDRIDQEAHVLSVSHRINDDLAMQIEVPVLRQRTDHIRRNGGPFTIETEGLGDIVGLGVYRFVQKPSLQLFAMAGLSIPTGSIDETGDTPRGKDTTVPYTMQLGSGSYDLQPGLMYIAGDELREWGAELSAKIRTGSNDRDYCLGDRATLSGWLKTQTLPWLAPHITGSLTVWDRIEGADERLDPTVAAVADPDLFGGTRALILLGADITHAPGKKNPCTLGAEFGLPVYQSLNGPQPGQDWTFNVSVTKGF